MERSTRPTEDGRDIVVYDGECELCNAQITRLKRWGAADRFEFVPRETDWLDERYPELAGHDFDSGMRVIKPDRTIHAAADAVYEIARQLPRWRWIAWLYRVPVLKQIGRFIYARIARNRHRIGRACAGGSCEPRS